MSENQPNSLEQEQVRHAILSSQIIAFNGFLFFALSLYLIIGSNTWQAYFLAGCALVATIGALTSIAFIRSGKIYIGRWVLLLTNTIAPALAGLAVTRIGLITIPYILISSFAIVRWAFFGVARKAIPPIVVFTIFAVIIEIINPAWTIEAQLVLFLGPIFIAISLAVGTIIILLSTAWNNFRISTKLLILVGLTLFAAISILTWRSLFNEQAQAQLNEEEQLNSRVESYSAKVKALEDLVASLAVSFANREDVITLYKLHDREGLLNLLTPIFTELNNEFNIRHMYIENPDGTVFVRIHDPASYGDDVTYRSAVSTTLLFHGTTSGVDIGPNRLSVRGVAPIFDNGDFVGLFEIGVDQDQTFLENLKAESNSDYNLWVTYDAAKEAGLQPGNGVPPSPSERIFYYAGTYPTPLELPEEIYLQVLETKKPSGVQYVSTDNGEVAVLLAPLIGHGKDVIGIIEVLVSRTNTLITIRENTRSILVTGVLATLFSLALLYLVLRSTVILPIRQLVHVSQRQLDGDFSIRAPVVSKDEFGQFASTFNALANNVQELIQSLEERVNERTEQLEKANTLTSQRVKQLEAIAQITRSISTISDIETLLPRITHMISQVFDFYHVGIFLLNNDKRFAVLRASNSEGGQKMLEFGHRLEVGQTGIVGHVASTGVARIAADVGADSIHFNNPYLPNTRSEMALPLRVGSEIIGVLDVQSTEPEAFSQEDINILSVLSDQVSIAIQNTHLLEEARAAFAETELAYSQLTSQTWSTLKKQAPILAYRFDGVKPEPLDGDIPDKLSLKKSGVFTLPIILRGVTVGNLRMKPLKDSHQFTEDEKLIAEAVAERVAIAADNARLILESQKRAAKEQIVGEVSTKIGSSIDLDNILHTALEEMGRILPGAEISLQINRNEHL